MTAHSILRKSPQPGPRIASGALPHHQAEAFIYPDDTRKRKSSQSSICKLFIKSRAAQSPSRSAEPSAFQRTGTGDTRCGSGRGGGGSCVLAALSGRIGTILFFTSRPSYLSLNCTRPKKLLWHERHVKMAR